MCVLRTMAGTLALFGAIVSVGQPFAAEIKQQPSFNLPLTPAPEVVSRPVELGSGWYLRGELGMGQDSSLSLVSGFVAPEASRGLIGFGFGYKQNNWMRYDVTLDYNRQHSARRAGNTVVCPYALYAVEDKANNRKYGFLWDAARETCSSASVGTLQKADFIGNFYIDLGTWSRVTPYLGVGLGISVLRMTGGLEFRKTVNGELYSVDLRPGADFNGIPHIWVDAYGNDITSWTDVSGVNHAGNPTVPFERQSWSRTGSQLKFNPAFALMAGFSFDVSEQLKGEVAWRYLNSGSLKSMSTIAMPESVASQLTSQQVTLGFRYMID